MRFTDDAILLSLTKYSESTAICRLLGRDRGLISGAVRGAMSKKNKGSYQAGNVFKVEWSARIADSLGSLKCELLSPISAYFLQDSLRLAGLNSLLSLTAGAIAEHDPHPKLYNDLTILLDKMKHNEDDWLKYYAHYELLLLSESGFRLDLDKCVATGEVDHLIYVSPKSGCAVSADSGQPYKEKLLSLPTFLVSDNKPNIDDICDSLSLTGYFLEHRLFASHTQNLPSSRKRFVEKVNKLLQSNIEAAKQTV